MNPISSSVFLREGVGGQKGETGLEGFAGVGEKTLIARYWLSIAESQLCFPFSPGQWEHGKVKYIGNAGNRARWKHHVSKVHVLPV